jgi:hypothetical protein
MNYFLKCSLFLLFIQNSYASLPKMDLPKSWYSCAESSDCIIAGDACRSCEAIYVINKKHADSFLKKD